MDERSTVLILGATSDIGRAIAHEYAMHGYALKLAARDSTRLNRDAEDLHVRHDVPVSIYEFDALRTGAHERFVDSLHPLPDTAICVVGLLGDQKESERKVEAAEVVLRTNFIGPANVLSILANRFEARGYGTIVGISSVAGDRGRASNYIYGSAKAGFTAFLSGLRQRLHSKNVKVVTVKPGFVATRMTKNLDLPILLTARPEEVAARIYTADQKKTNVIYVRWIWRPIMLALRALPEWVFVRIRPRSS